jgi:hypothetical protein
VILLSFDKAILVHYVGIRICNEIYQNVMQSKLVTFLTGFGIILVNGTFQYFIIMNFMNNSNVIMKIHFHALDHLLSP